MALTNIGGPIDPQLIFSKNKGKVHLTAKLKREYLEVLSRCGVKMRSAMAIGVCPQTIMNARKSDPKFEEAVQTAMELYRERIAFALQSRAVDGWDEPVFYRGEEVGSIRKYSDKLMELEAKRQIPEYRDHVSVDANVKGGVLVVGPSAGNPADWASQYGGASGDDEGAGE